jgi:hypothetical protein
MLVATRADRMAPTRQLRRTSELQVQRLADRRTADFVVE